MRKLIFYFILLLAAVWVGLKIASDPGYLLVAYQKVTVEMPLWLAVIGTLGVFIVFYTLLRIMSNIRSLGTRIHAWARTRRIRRAMARTQRGLVSLAAGDFQQAEKDLNRAAPRMDSPFINYLACAYCANAQNMIPERDEYLGKIKAHGKIPKLALGITQAKLELDQRQYEQALATLQQLQQIAPKNTTILRLLCQTYSQLKDWTGLETLFPQLEKYNVLETTELNSLQITIYEGLLAIADKENSVLVFGRIPKKLRYSSKLVMAYIPILATKSSEEAEELLRSILHKNLDDSLIIQYGLIDANKEKQLEVVENLLKTHPKKAVILLTAGRLCVKNQLWGKARNYFETSLAINPCTEVYQALGELLEHLGEKEQAMVCYKKGLGLVS